MFISEKVKNQYKNGKILKDKDEIEFKDILCNIISLTSFINPTIDINNIDEKKIYSDFFKWEERFFLILNKLNNVPKCPFCNKQRKFISLKKGYQDICSFKCASEKTRVSRGLISKEKIFNSINKDKYDILEIPEKLDKNNRLVIKCKKCGYISEYRVDCGDIMQLYNNDNLCRGCENTRYNSKAENEIYEFIASIYDKTIIRHDRNLLCGYELDIYIPEEKLAIEFDGLYWHSEKQNVVKWYHSMKTDICRKKGIKLIHIFEDEWETKKNIVKSKIRHIIHKTNTVIYARNCYVKEISFKTLKNFSNKNSIYECNKTSYNLGLFYEERLIGVIGFSKYRYNKTAEWELKTFCILLDINIPGAFSKLLSFFEKNIKPKNIIVFCDKRWEDSSFFTKMKFKLIKINKPSYFYTNCHILRINSNNIKHKNIYKYISKYDSKKTVLQNMIENGYSRIWDCGNLVFVKSY